MTAVLATTTRTLLDVELPVGDGCPVCGFTLWLPISDLSVSRVGLYNDRRFPGRVIVSARAHYEHIDEVEPHYLAQFMADIQRVSAALRTLDGVERTNMAILGNREAHVHAHVFPRRPEEPNAGRAPWDQVQALVKLDPHAQDQLRSDIAAALRGQNSM